MLDFRFGDTDGRHHRVGLAVGHDALVVHFQSKLPGHLLGEFDVDGLTCIVGIHLVSTDGRARDAEHVDTPGKMQSQCEYGA